MAAAGGARQIYEASDYERRVAGVFTALQLEKLRKTPLSAAETLAEECMRANVHILSAQEVGFPARLRQIPNHPLVLYVKGCLDSLGSLDCLSEHLPIAIVGTRRADRKSVDITSRLSADLVRAGCAVVSGGALGIDSAAHWGALHAQGKTVAVLGCGLEYNYLPENSALRRRVAETGAVVSEYPCGAPPLPRSFPIRNRIISGLSVGTVVIEAGERSGSLITATCAAEQGRDVFAVPGDAFGSSYTGGNKLIRDGAKPVFSAMDILEEYELLYPDLLNMRQAARDLERPAADPESVLVKKIAPKPPAAAKPVPSSPSAAATGKTPLEQAVLQCLSSAPLHIDEIAKAADAQASTGDVLAALTALEIEGLVDQAPGRVYARK